MNDQETSKINRYLLGDLPPDEMDALETRLLTEPGLFELAESVEDEVVDRYARGEMSREEARRFERRLLPSARIQERVAFARALASRRPSEEAAGRETRAAPVIPISRSPARLAWAATLVAALAAGALAFEVAQLRGEQDELRRTHAATVAQLEEGGRPELAPEPVPEPPAEDDDADRLAEELSAAREQIAELEAREAAAAERRVRRPRKVGDQAASATVFLTLATRAGGASGAVALEGLGEGARVELQLDLVGRRPGRPLVATLLRGGEPVYLDRDVPIEAMDGESMARLVLPRQSLLPGRYRVELAAGDGGETRELIGTYELSVTP